MRVSLNGRQIRVRFSWARNNFPGPDSNGLQHFSQTNADSHWKMIQAILLFDWNNELHTNNPTQLKHTGTQVVELCSGLGYYSLITLIWECSMDKLWLVWDIWVRSFIHVSSHAIGNDFILVDNSACPHSAGCWGLFWRSRFGVNGIISSLYIGPESDGKSLEKTWQTSCCNKSSFSIVRWVGTKVIPCFILASYFGVQRPIWQHEISTPSMHSNQILAQIL